MGKNLLAGIGDAYWYEWYVGLEKVLDLLNPDTDVVGVTLQASQQQGLDDVVVRYNDKKLECIQVKHTRKDSTLSYSFLFCEHTENGKKAPACIKEYSDDWKMIKDKYEQCIPIIYTNRKIGDRSYTPPNGKGYKRPPLMKFWMTLKEELETAESISDIQFSAMIHHTLPSVREMGKVYKQAFGNILQQMPSLSDEEKLVFLKEFQIYSDETKDFDNIKKFVNEKLANFLNVDERQCTKYHNRLLRGLTEWTVSTRSEEEITKEQVLSVLGLKKDELIGEHNFATEEPFFQSRVRWIKILKDEILSVNKGVFFISGEPGAGKTNIINYLANEDDSIITTRFHSFKPIQIEYDVMPADEGIYSAEDFWKNTLIQIKDKFEGCMEKYNVPVAVEAIKSVDKKIKEVLRLANCLYKETGKITVIVVDGIDHAARSGKKNTFLKTLPSPNRLPDGVVFLLAGQPYSNNPEYPLWLDGNDVITKAVPTLESEDIKQLLTDSNISFGDATVEEIAEYIFSVTKGNTLSVMYAVYDAKGHDSICNYEKYITNRNLANGIDAYYDYIWQSAMDKWDDLYKHVEIVLSGAMTLLNRGITIELLQTLLKDITKITDIQLVCWMQDIEPLIIKNDKEAYSVYSNDVRLFLGKKFERSGENKRIVADKVCEYILKENTNIALRHDSLFNSLIMANRRKEIPQYFDAKYAYEAVIENRPLSELQEQIYAVLEVLAEDGEMECLVGVSCAISTITQYQNSIFQDEDYFYNVEESLPCEKQALSTKTITARELLQALVQIKQLAEAGCEHRAKSAFKRWIGNRTPGQIGNKYASAEERQCHYNFNDTLKNVLRMFGKLCFIFGESSYEDKRLKKGEEDAEAFFAEGVFEACENSIDIAGIDKAYRLIQCYYPDDNDKFIDKLLLTGKKELIEHFAIHYTKGLEDNMQIIVLYIYTFVLGCVVTESPNLTKITNQENKYLEFLYKVWVYSYCDTYKCMDFAAEGIAQWKENQGNKYLWRLLVNQILFVSDLNKVACGEKIKISDDDFCRYVCDVLNGEPQMDVGVQLKIREFHQHLIVVMLLTLDKLDEKYKKLALPIIERRMENSCWLIENLWEYVLRNEKKINVLERIFDLWMNPKGKVWKMPQEEIKECAAIFIKMGKRMRWTEKVQAAENLLKAKRILGYSGHKEYGGYNLLRWYENISSDAPQIWKSLGMRLLNVSGVISETGDNRADVYVDAAVASSAGRCGINDMISFSYISNNGETQWRQTVFDAVIAYLENSKVDKNNLLSLWKCVCKVFPVLKGSSEYSYYNNINAVYREDLKKAILANGKKNEIVIEEEMKKIEPDCFGKICKLRDTYKIPNRWFEQDDFMAIEDSLQNCIVKISQEGSLGSNEWKVILPLLKQSVKKGENTCTEEIFSLVMQRPRDYANWEWDGVQNLLVELIPLLEEKDIRRLIQDIIDRNKEYQQKYDKPLSFFYPNIDIEYLAYAYNRNTEVEKRIKLYAKILDMHEMWITANGMIELPSLFELKQITEGNDMDDLIERLYQL
ncbi:MAG: AAA family ATPase [Lachnospiraceae bacterium]|nr:AAA family ATPase [Lachnospiraceae bacterium]